MSQIIQCFKKKGEGQKDSMICEPKEGEKAKQRNREKQKEERCQNKTGFKDGDQLHCGAKLLKSAKVVLYFVVEIIKVIEIFREYNYMPQPGFKPTQQCGHEIHVK